MEAFLLKYFRNNTITPDHAPDRHVRQDLTHQLESKVTSESRDGARVRERSIASAPTGAAALPATPYARTEQPGMRM